MPDIDIPGAIKGDPDTAFEAQTPTGFVYDNTHWALVAPDLGNDPEAPADDSVPSAWCPNHEQWEARPTDRDALYGLSFAIQRFIGDIADVLTDIHTTLALPGELSPSDVAQLIARTEQERGHFSYNMDGVESLTPPDTGMHVASIMLADTFGPGVVVSPNGSPTIFGLTPEDEAMLMSNPIFREQLAEAQRVADSLASDEEEDE